MNISIIGAGPTGVISALFLLEAGYKVSLYERSTAYCRKFLVAGSSGLNITHSDSFELFLSRYGDAQTTLKEAISSFSNKDLVKWLSQFSVETYEGSSGRIFPTEMSAAKIVIAWKEKLNSYSGFKFFPEHQFHSFSKNGLNFTHHSKIVEVISDKYIFCLGGNSWSKTGSDGSWIREFEKIGVKIRTPYAVNCGIVKDWAFTINERIPVKNIVISYGADHRRGELLITDYGLEGSGLYFHSVSMLKDFDQNRSASFYIDLLPDLKREKISLLLAKPVRKVSRSNYLRKSLNLDKGKLELLKLLTTKEQFLSNDFIINNIKSLSCSFAKIRPLDEAISTGGGIKFSSLNSDFSLKENLKIHTIGEMLDWSAPTGGYLLQACFSMGVYVAQSIIKSSSE